MITTGDIETILYRDLKPFGIERLRKGESLVTDKSLDKEYIRIIPKVLSPDTYWKKDFVEVNFLVPDITSGSDAKRLTEIERLCDFDKTSTFDGTVYTYSTYSTSQEEDTELKCHFVNARLLFEILNVK